MHAKKTASKLQLEQVTKVTAVAPVKKQETFGTAGSRVPAVPRYDYFWTCSMLAAQARVS